jgi:uncharacterized iron-regulated membrane protein
MRVGTIKGWYAVHKWASLISTLFLLLLCVTGLPLIFHEEIDHALGYRASPPALPATAAAAPAHASVDAMIADAQRRHPGDVMQFVVKELEEPNVWYIRMGTSPNGAITAYDAYDARTGKLINQYPLDEGVMNVMLRLHVDLFAGLKGTLFLGFMGVLLVAALVSGVVLYGPYTGRVSFGTVRRGRSPRLRWLDLHNVLGIVTAMWLLVVGATGVVNALATPIFARWQATQLAGMTAPYRDLPLAEHTAPVDSVLRTASAARPDAALSFLAFPGTDFASPHHFVAFMHGSSAATSRLLTPVLIDAGSADFVAKAELPWYVSTLLLSQPLHFGDFGEMPLKAIWALLDVLTIVVLASGVVLWVKRRDRPFEEWLRVRTVRVAEAAETAA